MGKRHVALGNLNLDIYLVVERLPEPGGDVRASEAYYGGGGAAANYAVAAASYGHEVLLAAHTGALAKAMGLLDSLRKQGVNVGLVRVHEDSTPGIVIVLITREGERTMVSFRGANEFLSGEEVRNVTGDVLHIASRETSIAGRAVEAASTSMVSYDPGPSVARREAKGIVEFARSHVDILFLNRLELRYIAGTEDVEAARRLLGGKLRLVVVKLGAEGALAVTTDAAVRVEAYKPRRVVDTTGAGDVFDAYFNAALLDGYTLEDALRYAAVAAGLKVERRGAQSAPSRAEVEEALQQRPPRVWRV